MTIRDATAPRPYSWLRTLMVVMTVVTLATGAIALHYIETRMITVSGKSLALTVAEVSDKLDRCLFERYGDVMMMAGTFSAQPHDRKFQSAYIARAKISYRDYLWIGVTNVRGQIVTVTDPATRVRRGGHPAGYWGGLGISTWEGDPHS